MKNEISKISKANRESYQKLDSYYLEKKLKELIIKDNKIAHVEYILTSPEIKNINNEIIEKLFEFIVRDNKTELVKLMSLSLPIKNVLNINNLLIEAIKQNNILMVEYLLTSQDLKKRADIDYVYIRREIHGELTPLVDACRLGQMEIIDFLLNSPLLSKKADIEKGETPPFKMACIIINQK